MWVAFGEPCSFPLLSVGKLFRLSSFLLHLVVCVCFFFLYISLKVLTAFRFQFEFRKSFLVSLFHELCFGFVFSWR